MESLLWLFLLLDWKPDMYYKFLWLLFIQALVQYNVLKLSDSCLHWSSHSYYWQNNDRWFICINELILLLRNVILTRDHDSSFQFRNSLILLLHYCCMATTSVVILPMCFLANFETSQIIGNLPNGLVNSSSSARFWFMYNVALHNQTLKIIIIIKS